MPAEEILRSFQSVRPLLDKTKQDPYLHFEASHWSDWILAAVGSASGYPHS